MQTVFAGKRIVVGVSGSIAAFKVAGWVSSLAKEEARVAVIMTDSATRFVTPLTFTALSGEIAHTDMFVEEEGRAMAHIQLGQEADLFLVAPATAQTIAKLAYGIADDLLSTTVLAAHCQVIICPAMNTQMFKHPATQENLEKLKSFGYKIVEPDSGVMACKDEGQGRLPEWDRVREILLSFISDNDMKEEKVLVTAGPTREALDPARFLSNRSSGKMGYALAATALRRGAEVTLISGPASLAWPEGVKQVKVQTAIEMRDAVMENCEDATIIVKAAAVSDFRPATIHEQKVKKNEAELSIRLIQNPDILQELGTQKATPEQYLVGFAAESTNILNEGAKKLEKKNLDVIAVNDISSENTGFEADTNQITLIARDGKTVLPFVSKEETAELMWDHIMKGVHKKRKP